MERVRHRRAAISALLALAAVQLVGAAVAPLAMAVTGCTYNPSTETINVQIDPGESAGLAVNSAEGVPESDAPPGAILIDRNGAGFDGDFGETQCGPATNANTGAITVLGSDGSERFAIDNLVGDEFATAIIWNIDLRSDAGDILVINAGNGDDTITLTDGAFSLNGGEGRIAGFVQPQVIGNEGDDTLDASAATTSVELFGSGGVDTLTGGSAADRLGGGDGTDRLLGGPADDVLDGGDNVDRLYGGDGADTCILDRASAACDPSIAVKPATVGAGEGLTVTGAGWYPENGDVGLELVPADGGDPQPLTVLPPTLEDWTINGPVTAPTTGGSYTLTACQPCGDSDAERPTAPFTVQGAAISPTTTGSEPTFQLRPSSAAPGESIDAVGQGWNPEAGRVRIFVDPSSPRGKPDAIARVRPDKTFTVTVIVPGINDGAYTVTACQRCNTTELVEQTATLTVAAVVPPPRPSPLPWILVVAAVLVLVGGGLLARRLVRPPVPHPPDVRLVAAEPTVTLVAKDDGSPRHEVRLIPYPDPGVQRVREGSPR